MDRFFVILREALNLDDDAVLEEGMDLALLDGWDSLGKFMFLSSVYSDYGVTLEVPDVNDAGTVGDLRTLIERAKGGQS